MKYEQQEYWPWNRLALVLLQHAPKSYYYSIPASWWLPRSSCYSLGQCTMTPPFSVPCSHALPKILILQGCLLTCVLSARSSSVHAPSLVLTRQCSLASPCTRALLSTRAACPLCLPLLVRSLSLVCPYALPTHAPSSARASWPPTLPHLPMLLVHHPLTPLVQSSLPVGSTLLCHNRSVRNTCLYPLIFPLHMSCNIPCSPIPSCSSVPRSAQGRLSSL